jgi:putative tryptophan/tyrosine transport system substrate-binding protein
MSYAPSLVEAYRFAGVYAGAACARATSPLTKCELVINPKTAKALGLDVPDTLLVLADEVMECKPS